MSATESFAELTARLKREREVPRAVLAYRFAVAITGTRERAATGEEMVAFWKIWKQLKPTELHHGDATGIDRFVASQIRNEPGIKIVAHPADWYPAGRPRSLGADRAAGPRRNRTMLLQVHALIAFPGGRGTQSCIGIAQELRRPVYFVGDHAAPTMSARSRKAHQHDLSSWAWSPERAAWIGRCISCHQYIEATPAEAQQLEKDSAAWADQHPLATP